MKTQLQIHNRNDASRGYRTISIIYGEFAVFREFSKFAGFFGFQLNFYFSTKLSKQENMYREEAIQLKDDYRRLLQQYADFQKKKEHFEEADNRKFSQVWKMNQEEVHNLVDR